MNILFVSAVLPYPLYSGGQIRIYNLLKRLSKRHGAESVLEYKTAGFLSEALINFLSRIGWGYKDEEIFTMDELIQKFELHQISQSQGIFNYEKLLWTNGQYLNKKNAGEIISLLENQL